MAVYSATDFLNNETTESKQYDVGFFSMKPDSETVVRIMVDNINDIEILTTHPVTVGASPFPNRQVNCLRENPHEPLAKCPLCNAGEKVRQRAFIKMIEYDPNTREPKAVVWDRAAKQIVPQLKSYLDNYGPLSNIMCKVVRSGAKLETKYDIVPNINPQVYNITNYPLPADNPFKDFKVLGRMVLDKTPEEITHFMQTGEFPQRPREQAQTTPVQEPVNDLVHRPVNQPVFVQSPGQQFNNGPVDPDIPFNQAPPVGENWQQTNGALQRPERY